MDPITTGLLLKNVLLPWLVNQLPTLGELFVKKDDFNKHLEKCFEDAVDEWKNEAPGKKYHGQALQRIDILKDVLNDNAEGLDEELVQLVERWIKRMRVDPICSSYIQEIKIDDIREKINISAKALQEIKGLLEKKLGEITKGQGTIIGTTQRIEEKLDALLKTQTSWICPYETVLNVDNDQTFLHDATETLIEENKVYRNPNVDRVKEYLKRNNICLVKASEGRGKTFLSRIVAHDFHREGRRVYFVDFGKPGIPDMGQNPTAVFNEIIDTWKKDEINSYFLVLENVHACPDWWIDELIRKIEYCRREDTDEDKGNVMFLLNARPTDEGVDYFEEWREVVKLNPNEDDIDKIVELYAGEAVGRQPFVSEASKESFIQHFNNGNPNQRGVNLRLLSYYLRTWLDNNDTAEVSAVTEDSIIRKLNTYYHINRIGRNDLSVLLYFSSISQFDVSLSGDIIDFTGGLQSNSNAVSNTTIMDKYVEPDTPAQVGGNYILQRKEGRYYMPHSFDAYFLCKTVCKQLGGDYQRKTIENVKKFVDTLLKSGNPRDYENDFIRLLTGIYTKQEEFREVIYYLTGDEKGKDIITRLNPRFVYAFLRPFNHENQDPQAFVDYYNNNKDWLIPAMRELSPGLLSWLLISFEKKLNSEIDIKDIFPTSEELENYLEKSYNYKLPRYSNVIDLICGLKEEGYKDVLKKHYDKEKLKPVFLGLNAIALTFAYRKYKKMGIDIIADTFENPKDLDDYLKDHKKLLNEFDTIAAIKKLGKEHIEVLEKYYSFNNIFENPEVLDEYLKDHNNMLSDNRAILACSRLGEKHFEILEKHCRNNSESLKEHFLGSSPTKLNFVIEAYRKCKINIYEFIFRDSKDLDEYLKRYYKMLLMSNSIPAICELGNEYKELLIKHYRDNKGSLKKDLLEQSMSNIFYVSQTYQYNLGISLIKDVFDNATELDAYLTQNNIYQGSTTILNELWKMGDAYKAILNKHYDENGIEYGYFMDSSPRSGYRIAQRTIDILWFRKKTFDVSHIDINDFCFREIHWMDLQRLVKIIQRGINDDNRKQSIELVKALVQKVLAIRGAFDHASSVDLSHFLANIEAVDETTAQSLKEEECVIEVVQKRLKRPFYTMGELYLFDHFYSLPWCKEAVDARIKDANDDQKETIKAWHDEIMKSIEKNKLEITPGGLFEYIHNLDYIQ